MKKPEILSPIQDFTSLSAAISSGADAVFFGVLGFNMRATAKNFTILDIPKIVEKAHKENVKVYIALNTIIYEEELQPMKKILEECKKFGVDAVICWDFAVIHSAIEVGLEVHLSTQASVSNTKSALFYKKLGIPRVVLARECDLRQIKKIKKNTSLEIETFVHGAMCVSISGRCFMSQFTNCNSANRGACRQPCRRNYIIKDVEGEYEFEVGQNYILSPKDLCALPFLEKLVFAGIDSFKIEGRNKSPEYVSVVTRAYREVVDFIFDNKKHFHTDESNDSVVVDDEDVEKGFQKLKESHMENMMAVFNRGFSDGFYMGKPMKSWTNSSGSVATERKVFLGKVNKIYKKINVIEIKIHADEKVSVGDEIYIQGKKTGSVREKIISMEIEHEKIKTAKQGDVVAIKVESGVRKNDDIYRIDKV